MLRKALMEEGQEKLRRETAKPTPYLFILEDLNEDLHNLRNGLVQ
jgi:hypothetical protein